MNVVRRAVRPKRRRGGDVKPDLQFLSLAEFEAVIRVIPDEVVQRGAGGGDARRASTAIGSSLERSRQRLTIRQHGAGFTT
jgi:hypothetical protein